MNKLVYFDQIEIFLLVLLYIIQRHKLIELLPMVYFHVLPGHAWGRGVVVVVISTPTYIGLVSPHGGAAPAGEGAAPAGEGAAPAGEGAAPLKAREKSGQRPERGSRVSRSTRTHNSTACAILGVRRHS